MVSRHVMPAAMTNNPSKNAEYVSDAHRVNEPKGAAGNQHEADQDAAFVAEFPRDQAGGNRHQEVSQIIGELHEAGLLLVDVQRILKLLVQDVNHPVAKAPQQEQRGDQRKGTKRFLPSGR